MGVKERKEREKNMRRQQIQSAALELFIDKGFNSITIEDIAQKAELSPGSLYQYFKNKEDLYASLNMIALQAMNDEIEKVYMNNDLSVEEKIIGFKDAMYRTFKAKPLLLRNALHVQLEDVLPLLTDKLIEQLSDLAQKFLTMVGNVFQEGVRQGKFEEGHNIAHADIIWAIFSGLVIWEDSKKKINPKKDFIKTTLDRAFDIFLKGIKKD